MFRLMLVSAVVAAVGAAGCGGPNLVKVSGRVTLDGKELADGEVILVPADPTQGPAAGKITGGRFELMAPPGPKKVEVRASREVPGKKDGAMGGSFIQFESIIAERYNDKTELTLDVPAAGVPDVLFELKSEKRAPGPKPSGP